MIDVDSHCSFLRFVYLFLAVLGLCLCCCVRASSSCESRGYSLAVVLGFLVGVASPVVEHGLYMHRLQ